MTKTSPRPDRPGLSNIRMWVHELGAEWTDDDIETCAWLLAHTEATVTCDLTHPDFARSVYRMNRMKGVSRETTLAGMATEFSPGTVAYVMREEP